ncbi:porin family protein [Flavobacterium sp. WC2416]|uniref:Porin family protein n=1 Tax=Flavobacterium sp. WC2416 TaxID=3234141 RepID=A0AB39WFC8_9FLAO
MSSNKNKTMRFFLSCFLLIPFFNAFSQEESVPLAEKAPTKIDSLYREDQFYFGFTYNTLQQKPAGLSQKKFSTGLSLGFLRDMPINKDRTVAIASGLGFSYNNYNQNVAITGTNQLPVYDIIDSKATYSKNKFTQLLIDLPVEFRWRTSTYESHKFWRIYGGVKFSYLIYDKSVFSDGDGKTTITGNKDFNKFLYGLYVSSGYNTINVYAYYGLNSIFKKTAQINGEQLGIKSLNIGVIFYIL